jgi:hypothetical protein
LTRENAPQIDSASLRSASTCTQPTRTQRESNKIHRIGKVLATTTNSFGPSA